jgi:CBS domain-containing protein
MTVAAVLRHKGNEVVSVIPATSLAEIAEIIAARRIGAVVVLDAGQELVGIVSERDVVKAMAGRGNDALGMTAAEVMTRKVAVASPATTVDEALEIMDAGYFRHLPVMQDGRLVGIVSIRDLVKHRLTMQEHQIQSLTTYVTRAY